VVNRKLVTIAIACWLAGSTGSTALATDEPEDARLAITNWIRCIECKDGELDRLTQFGEVIVPHLSTMLVGGPAQSTRDRVQQLNAVTYERLRAYSKKYRHSRFSIDKAVFLKTYLDNFILHYQIRAAHALAAIGGERAEKALTEVLETAAHPSLKAQIERLLEQAGSN
jgi:hypothetical protein